MTDHELQLCLDGDPVLTINLVNAYLRLQAEVERLRADLEFEKESNRSLSKTCALLLDERDAMNKKGETQ